MENKKAGSSGGSANSTGTVKTGGKPAAKSDSSAGMSNAERKYKNSVKYKKMQQQKLIKKVSIISALALALIVVGSFSGYYVHKSIYGHIMTFDGTKISVEDFKLVKALSSGESKEDILDVLTEYLVVDKEAEKQGISLTEDEIASAKAEIEGLKNYILLFEPKAPKASEESYIKILGIGNLYTRFQDLLKQEYVVDEEDFKTALEDYIDNDKQYYIDTQMKYVMTDTEEAAQFAREMLSTGMDVDEVIQTYSGAYTEANGIERVALSQLTLDAEEIEKLLALEVSEYSEVINLGETYAFFIIDEINVPEPSEIEEGYRETYIIRKVNEIFKEQVEEWTAGYDIEINQRAFDSVK